MKLHLLFVGNKFIYNKPLQEYIVRKVEEKTDFIHSITYFKENDNSLFLYLEQELNANTKLIIITTKQNFSTVGKLISTVTSDNQILKENMLIPSNCSVFQEGSYLLEYKDSLTNVLHIDEMQKLPEILIDSSSSKTTIHIFDEDKESATALLSPIAQTHDVRINILTLVDGWLYVNVTSKKYGNISKFINSVKQLLPNKLITTKNIILYIIEKLSKQNKQITFAESCTGGLLSYYFTKANGASKVLSGSLVTYSNELKENWLGVEHETIEAYGAVSQDVVKQMSDGAINVSDADYAISVSGIAGDTGGSDEKPVGTVHISVRSKEKHQEIALKLNGDRNYIQHQSALFAIKMLIIHDKKIFF